MFNNSGLSEDRGDIGSTCNFWREPVYETSEEDRLLIGENWRWNGLRIPQQTWIKNSETVDKILRLIVSRMTEKASNMYPGLSFCENVIKQGSSREGLKIEDAREFDYILLFEIKGLYFSNEVVRQFSNGCEIPGLIKRRVPVHIAESFDQHGWIRKNNILQEIDGGLYLNTKNLQKLVLTSILDSALAGINKKLKTLTDLEGLEEKYCVYRGVRPPTLQLKIEIYGKRGVSGLFDTVRRMQYEATWSESMSHYQDLIEVDLVPGMLLAVDKVPDPFSLDMKDPIMMDCYRYGVMKWVNSPSRASQLRIIDQDVLWRNSSCGYEKHMFDICRRNPSQRFIMTACRILKIALKRMSRERPTNQIPSILKSYHLKNICLYCVLFLTIPSDNNRVSSVREALGYFVKYIELSLEAGFLPHFFHGNPWISQLFPGSPYEKEKVKCNLIQNVALETINQGRLGLHEFINHTIYGLYHEEWRLDSDRIEKFRDLLD